MRIRVAFFYQKMICLYVTMGYLIVEYEPNIVTYRLSQVRLL